MANSVDLELMPDYVASDLGQHCLLRSVCPNTEGKYGILNNASVVYSILVYITGFVENLGL